jgi:high affinity sulfate transporter 1
LGTTDASLVAAAVELADDIDRSILPGIPQLILANPGPAVILKLRSAKFTDLIGEDKIFLTVGDAVKKFAPKAVENV